MTCTEEAKAKRRAHYAANREREIAKTKVWQAKNPEKTKQICNKWHRENRHKIKKNEKAYRDRNREALNARNAEWFAKNPEKRLNYVHSRRAKKLLNGGTFSYGEVVALYVKQMGNCAHCFAFLDGKYQIDHVIPVAAGGSNWITNIQLLCAPCNRRKSAADPLEFARASGRLL
jgi:5-methylcytosine-specific restriction endonuclease McrA